MWVAQQAHWRLRCWVSAPPPHLSIYLSGWWASTSLPKTILSTIKFPTILVICYFSVSIIFVEIFSKTLSGHPNLTIFLAISPKPLYENFAFQIKFPSFKKKDSSKSFIKSSNSKFYSPQTDKFKWSDKVQNENTNFWTSPTPFLKTDRQPSLAPELFIIRVLNSTKNRLNILSCFHGHMMFCGSSIIVCFFAQRKVNIVFSCGYWTWINKIHRKTLLFNFSFLVM